MGTNSTQYWVATLATMAGRAPGAGVWATAATVGLVAVVVAGAPAMPLTARGLVVLIVCSFLRRVGDHEPDTTRPTTASLWCQTRTSEPVPRKAR